MARNTKKESNKNILSMEEIVATVTEMALVAECSAIDYWTGHMGEIVALILRDHVNYNAGVADAAIREMMEEPEKTILARFVIETEEQLAAIVKARDEGTLPNVGVYQVIYPFKENAEVTFQTDKQATNGKIVSGLHLMPLHSVGAAVKGTLGPELVAEVRKTLPDPDGTLTECSVDLVKKTRKPKVTPRVRCHPKA